MTQMIEKTVINDDESIVQGSEISDFQVLILSVECFAMRQKWAEAGLITRDEMQTDCCYATQDKTWVKDPDGNEWEVFVVLQDHLPETSRGAVTADDWHESATEGIAREVSCCATTATEVEPLARRHNVSRTDNDWRPVKVS